jgi:hypothetical protein
VAELVDELAEGGVGVAEAAGHLLLGQPVEEDSPQGFILAVQRSGGFPEEAPARGVVHNG